VAGNSMRCKLLLWVRTCYARTVLCGCVAVAASLTAVSGTSLSVAPTSRPALVSFHSQMCPCTNCVLRQLHPAPTASCAHCILPVAQPA
jgi:hypothetical protein